MKTGLVDAEIGLVGLREIGNEYKIYNKNNSRTCSPASPGWLNNVFLITFADRVNEENNFVAVRQVCFHSLNRLTSLVVLCNMMFQSQN